MINKSETIQKEIKSTMKKEEEISNEILTHLQLNDNSDLNDDLELQKELEELENQINNE